MEDHELVACVLAGDVDGFEVLVGRHLAAARWMAWSAGAGADTDDVVQEAFVRAFAALQGFLPGAPFRPWLLRIVVNQTRNAQRARRARAGLVERVARLRVVTEVADRHVPDPAEAVLVGERDRALAAGLRALPEKDRQVLSCRYLLELSEQETAEVLGWPLGSVKSRASRALVRLRGLVGAEVGELSTLG